MSDLDMVDAFWRAASSNHVLMFRVDKAGTHSRRSPVAYNRSNFCDCSNFVGNIFPQFTPAVVDAQGVAAHAGVTVPINPPVSYSDDSLWILALAETGPNNQVGTIDQRLFWGTNDTNTLVIRPEYIRCIEEAFHSSECKHVCLFGASGIGKSCFAFFFIFFVCELFNDLQAKGLIPANIPKPTFCYQPPPDLGLKAYCAFFFDYDLQGNPRVRIDDALSRQANPSITFVIADSCIPFVGLRDTRMHIFMASTNNGARGPVLSKWSNKLVVEFLMRPITRSEHLLSAAVRFAEQVAYAASNHVPIQQTWNIADGYIRQLQLYYDIFGGSFRY